MHQAVALIAIFTAIVAIAVLLGFVAGARVVQPRASDRDGERRTQDREFEQVTGILQIALEKALDRAMMNRPEKSCTCGDAKPARKVRRRAKS